jgi:hypothetical protein
MLIREFSVSRFDLSGSMAAAIIFLHSPNIFSFNFIHDIIKKEHMFGGLYASA